MKKGGKKRDRYVIFRDRFLFIANRNKMEEKVTRMEDILEENSSDDDTLDTIEIKNRVTTNRILQDVPKGKPKSGRIWKEPRKRYCKKSNLN